MHEPTIPLSATTMALLRKNLCGVIGPMEIVETLAEVYSESHGEEWRNSAKAGLWVFGRAINGDAWAIDTQEDERVVVISHDLLWEEEVDSAREAALPVAASLGEALDAARAGTLPTDYFTASEGEIPEEPEARLPVGNPAAFDCLPAPLSARAGLLVTLLGAGTTATWEQLEDAYFELEPLERAVLSARFALAGGKPSTLEEVAKTLQITPDEVTEHESRGARWLKRLVARGAPK